MFRTIVFSAFGAGLAACVAVSTLQAFTTEPLILHAEEFENAAAATHDHDVDAVAVLPDATAPKTHEDQEWAPSGRLERTLYTVLANLVVGVAVSLMLLGFMVLRGGPVDARLGLLWGLGGFVAVSLLPSLGLPPELPGTPAAEIVSRQVWWLATAAISAVGIALIVLWRGWRVALVGLGLLIIPHVVGAPAPPGHDVAYPGALAGDFVIASLVVSAVLWCLSGTVAGWLHQRLSASA